MTPPTMAPVLELCKGGGVGVALEVDEAVELGVVVAVEVGAVNAVVISFWVSLRGEKGRKGNRENHTKSRRQGLVTEIWRHVTAVVIRLDHVGTLVSRSRCIIVIGPLERSHVEHTQSTSPRILVYTKVVERGRETSAHRNHLAIADFGTSVTGAADRSGGI